MSFDEVLALTLISLEPTIRMLIGLTIGFLVIAMISRLLICLGNDYPVWWIVRKHDDMIERPLTQVEKDRIAWWGR